MVEKTSNYINMYSSQWSNPSMFCLFKHGCHIQVGSSIRHIPHLWYARFCVSVCSKGIYSKHSWIPSGRSWINRLAVGWCRARCLLWIHKSVRRIHCSDICLAARSLAMLDARNQPRSTVDIWHCCVAQTRFDYVACTACCQQNTYCGEGLMKLYCCQHQWQRLVCP